MTFARGAVSGRVARAGRVSTVRAQDPATILGARLVGLYEADACVVSGGLATTILDKSGTGNISTTATGMTWNAASATFNGRPTWSLDGSTSTFQIANFLLGKPSSALLVFAVVNFAAIANAATLASYAAQFAFREAVSGGNKMQLVSGTRSGLTGAGLTTNTPMTTYGYASEPVGSQYIGTDFANVGESLASVAANASMAASAAMQIGAGFGGSSQFVQGELAAIVVAAGMPAARESAALIRWAQRKFGVAG